MHLDRSSLDASDATTEKSDVRRPCERYTTWPFNHREKPGFYFAAKAVTASKSWQQVTDDGMTGVAAVKVAAVCRGDIFQQEQYFISSRKSSQCKDDIL
jgi:hypothetical protein